MSPGCLPGNKTAPIQSAASTVPSQFRPIETITIQVDVVSNGAVQTTVGIMQIASTGTIVIYKDASGSNFTTSQVCGLAHNMSGGWFIA